MTKNQQKKEKNEEYLNIVNDNDMVMGSELRSVIHKKGLRHREVHVFFFNQEGVFFQHRAKNKDTYPDFLDATVGGHVEIDDSYAETAVKEMEEESGIKVDILDFEKSLEDITLLKTDSFDRTTGNYNNTFRKIYAYRFDGEIGDLRVERGKAQGFVLIAWENLYGNSGVLKNIIPDLLDHDYINIYKKIKTFL